MTTSPDGPGPDDMGHAGSSGDVSGPAGSAGAEPRQGATPQRRARSVRRLFAMLVLLGEALVVGFATLVAKDLAGVGRGTALLAGGILAVLCLLAAGLLRSRIGYLLGWLIQVLLIASALWVPVMLFLGLAFGALWVTGLVQGSRADQLTARRQRAADAPPRD